MAKLIVSEFVSLNGIMEAPGGEATHPHAGWTFDSIYGEDHYGYKAEELEEADSLLLGRKTYEGFAAAWPQREGPFADKFNSMPKYAVSSTLTDPEWENTTVLSGDAVESVRELKETLAGPILLNGSAQLAHALTEADLVDEFRAMVHPVLVADGLRMFPDPAAMQKLKLQRTVAYDSGVALLIYERAED
ncbi:MAG TPA: dihydrofolate reductase family protein [Solirubrobacterales bacterium]|nr:dihydrofolate reductase family protein [Solirubrobacterales bacterium]